MNFHSFLLKDTKGNKSATLTVFIIGAIVVNFKLLFSGATVGGLTLSAFTGSDYAMAMASLGSIYVMRRNTDPMNKPQVVMVKQTPGGE